VWIKRRLQKEIFNKSISWRPLNLEEIAGLAPGQPLASGGGFFLSSDRKNHLGQGTWLVPYEWAL
jgi:hypothetical protein